MGIKESILKKYYSQSRDGLPEISAGDLLQAMEEYKLQAEEKAFAAAREKDINTVYKFLTYVDYQASSIISEIDESENIRLIADSIMPQFIPHDTLASQFSFNFKTDGNNYKASYIKDANGYWVMEKWTI